MPGDELQNTSVPMQNWKEMSLRIQIIIMKKNKAINICVIFSYHLIQNHVLTLEKSICKE